MNKVIIKNIISNVSSIINGYRLIETPDGNAKIIETSNVSISLTFNNGLPKIDYNNQKVLTNISDIK